MVEPAGFPADTSINYETDVKRLPPPSWDQSERFARYLSEAHSWYKLPVDSERPFFLFLDPAAGCIEEYRENRPWRPVEITKIGDYSQTTAQYRVRFGFWSYHQMPPGSPYPAAVWLSDGSRILLSDDWKNAGRALLDAFVHTNTPYHYLGGWDRFTMEKWPAESIYDRIALCLKERFLLRPNRLKDVLEAQIPAKFRSALRPPDISSQPLRPSYVWPDDPWKQRLLESQVPPALWSPLSKYFELLNHEQQLDKLCKHLPPTQDFPPGVIATALAEERVLQLIRLTDAMSSFLRRLAATRTR